AANLDDGIAWSTSRHSFARRPLMPSASVENTSARSRRTFLLSTSRVRPPVPGRTPRSGVSGNETALDPSSFKRISSQAAASSYPPPDAVPLTAQTLRMPEWIDTSSRASRVSFVYLQKFTLNEWVDEPSMKM